MRVLTLGIIAAFVLSLGACSSDDLADSNSAEGAFRAAEKYEKDERYEEALQKFREVQNKHPYSKFAVEAKLRIANIHYARESYVESQAAYQLMKELHPKHEKIDFITFRLGMSYFMQLPSTTDRDLAVANKAILYFDEVVKSYPKSEHVKEAGEKRGDSYRMLAEKEKYIADFYFKREMYDSAMRRYEKLIDVYPQQVSFHPAALYGAATSALRNGDREHSILVGKKLFETFPSSEEAERLKREFDKNGIR